MTPGAYLQKRRAIAGHTIGSLERDLSLIDGLGRATYADSMRVQRRLQDAENDAIYLTFDQASLLASIIPINPVIYRQLVDWHEDRAIMPPRLCRNCGAAEIDAAQCERCADAISNSAFHQTPANIAAVQLIDDHGVERYQLRSV